MDVEKLITDYIALQWELLDADEEKRQSVEAKLAATKEQLAGMGMNADITFSHEACGGIVVGMKSTEPMYYCSHCHQKGDVDVRFEHDNSGYATFVGEVSN